MLVGTLAGGKCVCSCALGERVEKAESRRYHVVYRIAQREKVAKTVRREEARGLVPWGIDELAEGHGGRATFMGGADG